MQNGAAWQEGIERNNINKLKVVSYTIPVEKIHAQGIGSEKKVIFKSFALSMPSTLFSHPITESYVEMVIFDYCILER